MRAVRAAAPGVRVEDAGEPGGDGELIKVTAVSICASDLSYIRRGSARILGHEIAGVTADGSAVAVEGIFGCGTCRWCQQGRLNLCRRAGTDILGLTTDGGMSEYFRVPRDRLVPVPAGLAGPDACLAEPGAVAWHAVSQGAAASARVAVVGAGAIGLLAVAAAQQQGAAEVSLEARHPHQAAAGEQLGATRLAGEYELVIEASGSESGLARAFELASPRGTVSCIGVYPDGISWPYRAAFLKELRVIPSMGYDRHDGVSQLSRVMTMLAARPEIAALLITHRFGIEEAGRAFEVAAGRTAGTFRVAVHP